MRTPGCSRLSTLIYIQVRGFASATYNLGASWCQP